MRLKPLLLGPTTLALAMLTQPARAQPAVPGEPANQFAAAVSAAAQNAQPSSQPATLIYANREIVRFRATVLSRTPPERAAAAVEYLNRLVDESPQARVTAEAFDEGTVVSVGGHGVFLILSADVDTLAGERLDRKAAEAAARLQLAFGEAVELRNPSRLFTAGLLACGATVVYLGLLWLLRRIQLAGATRLSRTTERQLERLPGGEIIVLVAHTAEYVRRAATLLGVLLGLLFTYSWLTFVLRRFPYTRPWGESLRTVLLSRLASVGQQIVNALPGLFAVMIIVLITRFLARAVSLFFEAVEQGRVSIPWLHPETAQPTRRIVTALLWLFALVLSYGYLPGSGSDAFKGVSVFVGLIVSLGSTGIMNQVMSGFTIIYSRTVRLGDFVKIGDVEGTVTHLGTLSTKVKTVRNEEVTIPNAVVVSNAATNYSRHAESEGVFVPTSVTIGYDAPWRQVQALLLLAAERTQGVRREPKPVVRQSELEDFYVKYTLLVCLEQPRLKGPVLDALHANIQDAFNEFGVQIMSPNYEADPSGPKIVPKDRWYAAPAEPPETGRELAQTEHSQRETIGGVR